MGKRGNKARKQSRRFRETEARIHDDNTGIGEGAPWEDLEDEDYQDAIAMIPKKEKEVKAAEDKKFQVTILKDHRLEYPDLSLQVYLQCDRLDEASLAEMFVRSNCRKAKSLDEADLVVFGGGPDIDPAYYGVSYRHPRTHVNDARDSSDTEAYYYAYSLGIPMVGICRGAQLLHVHNGGKLYQDVDNHHTRHSIIDKNTGEIIQNVSSVHHQMCMDNRKQGQEVIATASVSRNRFMGNNIKDIVGRIEDIEAFFYRETACLGFQGHPEYKGYNKYTVWCLEQIQNYISHNPDLEYRSSNEEGAGFVRLKPELIAQREGLKEKEGAE